MQKIYKENCNECSSLTHKPCFPCLMQDFLGQAFCTLGEIVGSLGSRLEKPLT